MKKMFLYKELIMFYIVITALPFLWVMRENTINTYEDDDNIVMIATNAEQNI